MKSQTYQSVWDAIEPTAAAAASMKARSALMTAVRDAIDGWQVTQSVAAKRLHITQPRLNDLLRGRIQKFSLDALVELATSAGLSVRLKIAKAA